MIWTLIDDFTPIFDIVPSFVWRIAPYTCLVVALISAGSLIKVQLARTRNVTERNNPSTGSVWPYIATLIAVLVTTAVNVVRSLNEALEELFFSSLYALWDRDWERFRHGDWCFDDSSGRIDCYATLKLTELSWSSDERSLQIQIVVFFFTISSIVAAMIVRTNVNRQNAAAEPVGEPAPIGHTPDGQPIYPIVGYTPDGQPVTADRVVGLRPTPGGTNSMAIVALIMGLTVAPLGIVFGHIGLSQIKRTGEGGRGLAIAGLILGYIGLAASIILIIFYASLLNGAY